MKKLTFNNETYEAEKIIKTDIDIIGQDSNSNELFAFRGISDFSTFVITNEDGISCDFDKAEPNIIELQAQVFSLTTQLINGGVL